MYIVFVFDVDSGKFVPAKTPAGKTLAFDGYDDAAVQAGALVREGGQAFVQYSSPRKRRGKRNY